MQWLADAQEPLLCVLLACDLPAFGRLAAAARWPAVLLGADATVGAAAWRAACEHQRLCAAGAGLGGSAALAARGEVSWRRHCRALVEDRRRGWLRPAELSESHWTFNFSLEAGGRGEATARSARFLSSDVGSSEALEELCAGPCGILELAGYTPPLKYSLSANGRQLQISNYPVHTVQRLQSGSWLISNRYVRFVSHAAARAVEQPSAPEQADGATPAQWAADRWERPPVVAWRCLGGSPDGRLGRMNRVRRCAAWAARSMGRCLAATRALPWRLALRAAGWHAATVASACRCSRPAAKRR